MEMPEMLKVAVYDTIDAAMDEASDATTNLNTALELVLEERIVEAISELKGTLYFLQQAKTQAEAALRCLEKWGKNDEDDD